MEKYINIILLIALIVSVFKWLSNYMALKGVLYYFGSKYGEKAIENLDMENIIKVAIEKTFNDIFGRN